MPRAKTGFDRYVEDRMANPAFAAAHAEARSEIDQIDRLVRQIDLARVRAGLSKAALARLAHVPPESIRRLLTSRGRNPTLETVLRLASVVGLRVELRAERPPRRTRASAAHP